MSVVVPPALVERAIGQIGFAGRDWCDRVPSGIDAACDRWGVTVVAVLPLGLDLAMSVLVSDQGGVLAVARISASLEQCRDQATALTLWDGRGSARLLTVDHERGIVLAEALDPQVTLRSVPSATGIVAACDVARQLWIPPPTDVAFTRGHQYADQIYAAALRSISHHGRSLPPEVVAAGWAASRRLAALTTPVVVLHGDLHRSSILASRRQGWAAIDPAPAIGTPAFDLADLTADYLDDHVDTDDALAVLWETLQRIEASCGRVGASSTVADWMLIKRVHQIAIDLEETMPPAWDERFAQLLASIVTTTAPPHA